MPKAIVNNVLVAVFTAVVLLFGGAIGNWATEGGLLRLLNGVTVQQMRDHVNQQMENHQQTEIQVGTLYVEGIGDAMRLRDPDGDQYGLRGFLATENFASSFLRPPCVVLGMTWLDTGNSPNTRVTIEVVRVTTTGFDFRVNTWGRDSYVASVGAGWVAVVPAAQQPCQTGW